MASGSPYTTPPSPPACQSTEITSQIRQIAPAPISPSDGGIERPQNNRAATLQPQHIINNMKIVIANHSPLACHESAL